VTLLQAVVLGIVQGVTAFLPISSTAHLRIVPALFGWHFYGGSSNDPGAAFTAFLQLGTLLALVAFLWRELLQVGVAWARGLVDRTLRPTLQYRLGWYLLLATIPFAVLAVVFHGRIDEGARDLWILAFALIGLGIVLYGSERVARRERDEEQLATGDAIGLGAAQVLSLVPGISRPGVMIAAGLFRGLTRETAARFSFLLSVPAVVFSVVYGLAGVSGRHGKGPGVGLTGLAVIIALLVGVASLSWLLRWLTRHTTDLFSYYSVALGVLVIVLLGTGVLHATR
jgi:undecaprenyl-diphosphatase